MVLYEEIRFLQVPVGAKSILFYIFLLFATKKGIKVD